MPFSEQYEKKKKQVFAELKQFNFHKDADRRLKKITNVVIKRQLNDISAFQILLSLIWSFFQVIVHCIVIK